jgi:NADH:ubiquinone oxidoreductase subunit 3 (subunit A)
MSDTWIAVGFLIFLLLLLGGAIVMLLWPSKFLRHYLNPLEPDTPVNRVQTRAMGIYFFLFVLMIISAVINSLGGFSKNILVALIASPVVLAIFLWFIWRYSPLQHVQRRFLAGNAEEPQWELRMSIAFCTFLLVIVVGAFLLATRGIHPK